MAEKIVQIECEKIIAGRYQCRLGVDDEKVSDLVASIRRVGIINPLLVCSQGDKFLLLSGHHRLIAAVHGGLLEVPCIVRSDNEASAHEVALADNLFRADLTPVETASAIRDLVVNKIMDVSGVAKALHRSEHWVARQLALLDWPPDVLEQVHAGTLSVAAAANLALIEDKTYREFLLRNASESGATARVTAAWLQAWRSMAPAEEALQAEPAPGATPPAPMVPQAPCICCGEVFRTDQLAHIPCCTGCIAAIRRGGR